jgi:hypothetical protein
MPHNAATSWDESGRGSWHQGGSQLCGAQFLTGEDAATGLESITAGRDSGFGFGRLIERTNVKFS